MARSDPVQAAFRAILQRNEGSFRYFLENYLITRDDHDQNSPAKPFPKHPYIGFLADEFQNGPELFYIAKSRQVMVSWLLSAFTLWVCLYKPLKVVLFQSKKEEDAAKMIYTDAMSVGRVSFMLSRLPEWMQVCRNEKGGYTRLPQNLDGLFANGKMTLPNGSQAIALAQGAAQVESWSPYLFINDEASLQDEWASAQAAASPALAGGGRGITAGTMRMPSDYGEEIEPSWYVKPDNVSRGIARFTSKSGIPSIRLHYSADPTKDPLTEEGQKWVSHESAKMKDGVRGWRWRQHMEIDPLAGAGEIVLPPTNDDKAWAKIICPPISYHQMVAERWSFDAGLDYGARNATVWLVFAMAPTGMRYLVHELSIPAKDVGGIPGICRMMHSSPFLKHVNGRIYSDPTVMFNADQNALGGLVTKSDLFAANGVFLTKAPGKGQSADDVLLGRLLGYYWDGWEEGETFYPSLRIFSSCKQTLQNLPLIRYQDWSEGLKAQKAFKEAMEQKYCNEWDAMKYAESAWPEIPTYSAPAAAGTYSWYLKRARSFDRSDADIYHRSGVKHVF